MLWMSEVEVTQTMLDAGHIEMKKVAEEQHLSFALKLFSQETIDVILTEGFRAMYRAMKK